MTKIEHEGNAHERSTTRREKLRVKWAPIEPSIPLRPFIDYAWDNYDPLAVASYLLSADDVFYRHKSILHEGFCAWVACPSRRQLREDGMIYRIAKAIDAAEAPWRERATGFNRSIGETVGRMLRADRHFFEEAYYPVGGAGRILNAVPRQRFKRTLLKQASDMLEAVHLVALHHYHITYLKSQKIYHVPSKEAGAALLKQAFGAPNSQLFVEGLRVKPKTTSTEKAGLDGKVPARYKLRVGTSVLGTDGSWNQSRTAVAYAYAAASIQTGPERTLLHEIVACQSTRAKHRALMQEWCGRARFVVDCIISECHDEQKRFNYGAQIPPVEPIAFKLPSIFPFVPEIIEKGYINSHADRGRRLAENVRRIRNKFGHVR